MAPALASEQFLERNKGASFFSVTLYGSLAATGEGHMTDKAILDVLGKERTKILWEPETFLPQHPNGLRFESYDNEGETMESWTTFSIGGGDLSDSGERKSGTTVYPHSKMKDILEWCQANGRTFWEYVDIHEENDVWDYLAEVWKAMTDSVERGLDKEGVLPGGLNLSRKAASFYIKAKGYQGSMQRRSMTFSFALAVSEENASGGIVVTAPTCGSSGVLPGLLYLNRKFYDFSDSRIIKAIATAGLIGNIIKTNASISGAEVGCQGEVGSACAMAAGAGVQLFGGTPAQIEYAASIGIEHFLGLTCDPVCGLVQIPCIERNAFGATRAVDANMYALLSDGKHLVSFDTVVEAMKRTGHDLPRIYKETAAGGLAELVGKV